MSADVEPVEVNETDSMIERVHVTTEDATGKTRTYRVSLGADKLSGEGYILSGRRIDGVHSDKDRPTSPSDAAWDAAADHFLEQGYEVAFR